MVSFKANILSLTSEYPGTRYSLNDEVVHQKYAVSVSFSIIRFVFINYN